MSGEQRDDGDSSLTGAAHHKDASPDNMVKTSPTISSGHQPMISSPVDITSPTIKKNNNDNSTDDTTLTPGSQSDQNKANLRRGKWTPEEEAYARAVICDFNSGYLDAPIGTTLRAYLSGKLECDPMRITKKFTKDDSIGKKVFRPAPQHDAKIAKEIEIAQVGLFMLILACLYHKSRPLVSHTFYNHKGKSCHSLPKLEAKDTNAEGRVKPEVVSRSIAYWRNHTEFKTFITSSDKKYLT